MMYRYYLHQESTCLGTHVTDINLSNNACEGMDLYG